MESKHHVVIPEPQDSPPEVPQIRVASRVIFSLRRVSSAVEFDGNSQGYAAEVEEEGAHRVLTAELEPWSRPARSQRHRVSSGEVSFLRSCLARAVVFLTHRMRGRKAALVPAEKEGSPLSPTLSPAGGEGGSSARTKLISCSAGSSSSASCRRTVPGSTAASPHRTARTACSARTSRPRRSTARPSPRSTAVPSRRTPRTRRCSPPCTARCRPRRPGRSAAPASPQNNAPETQPPPWHEPRPPPHELPAPTHWLLLLSQHPPALHALPWQHG